MLNVPWKTSTLSLSSLITEASLVPVLSVAVRARMRLGNAGLDSGTFGSSADHGSAAQTWKCSDVSSQAGLVVRDLIPSDIFSH